MKRKLVCFFFLFLFYLENAESVTMKYSESMNEFDSPLSNEEVFWKIEESEWGQKILNSGKDNITVLLSAAVKQEKDKLKSKESSLEVQIQGLERIIEGLQGREQQQLEDDDTMLLQLNTFRKWSEEQESKELKFRTEQLKQQEELLLDEELREKEEQELFTKKLEMIKRDNERIVDLYGLLEKQQNKLSKKSEQSHIEKIMDYQKSQQEIHNKLDQLEATNKNKSSFIFLRKTLSLLLKVARHYNSDIKRIFQNAWDSLGEMFSDNSSDRDTIQMTRLQQKSDRTNTIAQIQLSRQNNVEFIANQQSKIQSKEVNSFLEQQRNTKRQEQLEKREQKKLDILNTATSKLKRIKKKISQFESDGQELENIIEIIDSTQFQQFFEKRRQY